MTSKILKAVRASYLRDLREKAEHYEHELLNGADKRGELSEGPTFYTIGTFWDCPNSSFGLCTYHITDRAKDHCVFCRQPAERK